MKILHIITSLENGGAENTLYKICKFDKNNEHIVISLKGSGKYFSLLKKMDIKVNRLNIRFYSFNKFFSLVSLIRSLNPDIVQTWLPHSDFLGSIASILAGNDKILWNVRYSDLKFGSGVKLKTIVLTRILSKLSFIIPKKIISVSKGAIKSLTSTGYCNSKFVLIQNGYDLNSLKNINKLNYRKKYKIKNNIPIIGTVARYHPIKDHNNLLIALSIIKKKNINFFCILIGAGIKNKNLIIKIKKLGLYKSIKLLGETKDTPSSVSGLNLHVLSSKTEGFPNVLAEAMACGTPCVATDVGDSSLIVGKTGWIVKPENPNELAKAIQEAFLKIGHQNWKIRCNKARLRIKSNFGIKKMINSYIKVWSEVNKKI